MHKTFFHTLLFVFAVGCGAQGGVEQPGNPQTPQVCTLIGCTSGATYLDNVPLNGQDPALMEVTRCINGACESAPVKAIPGTTSSFTCGTASRFFCELSVPNPTTASLFVEIPPPTGTDPLVSLQDGDQYVVTIGVPGQPAWLKLSATAGYQVHRPNGPGCAPVCKQVALVPSA